MLIYWGLQIVLTALTAIFETVAFEIVAITSFYPLAGITALLYSGGNDAVFFIINIIELLVITGLLTVIHLRDTLGYIPWRQKREIKRLARKYSAADKK